LSSNKRLVQQLIWWHCAIRKIEDEMAFRLRDKPVANLILDLEASKFSSSEIDPYLASRILRLLIRSQDRESYRPTDYGSDDIQSEVILKLLEHRRKVNKSFVINRPLKVTGFPTTFGLSASRSPRTFRRVAEDTLRHLLPCLRGDFEKLRARARRTSPLLKDYFNQWEAQKRQETFYLDLYQCEIFTADNTDAYSLKEEFEKYYPIDIALKLSQIISRIKEKTTRKGIICTLELCYKHHTVKEACKLAGITPRTFRNHIPIEIRSHILKHPSQSN